MPLCVQFSDSGQVQQVCRSSLRAMAKNNWTFKQVEISAAAHDLHTEASTLAKLSRILNLAFQVLYREGATWKSQKTWKFVRKPPLPIFCTGAGGDNCNLKNLDSGQPLFPIIAHRGGYLRKHGKLEATFPVGKDNSRKLEK